MADFVPVQQLTPHPDARGNFFEMLRFKDEQVPGDGYTYCITIEPGARRGDHYHKRKVEWLTCVAGEITVLAETPEGAQQKLTLRADAPATARFDAGVVHAFLNEGTTPAIGIIYGSLQHSPENPDTFPKVIDFRGGN